MPCVRSQCGIGTLTELRDRSEMRYVLRRFKIFEADRRNFETHAHDWADDGTTHDQAELYLCRPDLSFAIDGRTHLHSHSLIPDAERHHPARV
jgi:hypothetical protein